MQLTRAGVARLAGRRVMQLRGPDALKFAQAILSNDLRPVVAAGDAVYGAFLTTKGRVVGDCNVVKVADDTLFVDYDARVEEDLLKHLKRYKLRLKVALEPRAEDISTFAAFPAKVEAGSWVATPLDSGVDAIRALNIIAEGQEGVVIEDPRGPAFGVRAYLASGSKLNVPDHFEEVDESAYADQRIALGAAEGSELADGIPLENNLELLRGVSFRKGCYVGQELTARTQFKGNVRKRIVPLALVPSSNQDVIKTLSQLPFQSFSAQSSEPLRQFLVESTTWESDAPAVGDKIVKTGATKAVGTILSVGTDVNAAIAMMRLEHLLPGEAGEAPLMDFTTLDGRFHAVPYQPSWWPALDLSTGKMLI